MSNKKPDYQSLRHQLDTNLLQNSNLADANEQQQFVIANFKSIDKHYQSKHVNHDEYLKLVNRLASYKSGYFNDFLDSLVGAAHLGLLDIVIERSKHGGPSSPEATRQRSQLITDQTGIQPAQPENE